MVTTVPEIIKKVNPKKRDPLAKHTVTYDSSSETLEPLYFFILDLMSDFGLAPQKLIDNFTASPGSEHFGDMGQRASLMQQQGAAQLERINGVLRSVLNIIQDLKDFRVRLSQYDDLKSSKPEIREAAILALKQVWMNKVDMQRSHASIANLSRGQPGFQTLMDAFLIVKDPSLKGPDGKEIDLNDRVKRILRERIHEFNQWLVHSEEALRKKYELEKNYLKGQVNSLKLYTRWAKPYLKAAQELEAKERSREPALVKAFNTIILEMVLLGKRKIKIQDEILEGNLPEDLKKIKTRDHYACVLVDFNFRGVPRRTGGQHGGYMFTGRTEVTFSAYVLNEDEEKRFNEEFEDSDIYDALRLIEGATDESLKQMQDDINEFLDEEPKGRKLDEGKEKKSRDKSNPFLALLGKYEKKPEKKKIKDEKKKTEIRPESYAEKEHVRKLAEGTAKETAFKLFDIFKKAHGMASFT